MIISEEEFLEHFGKKGMKWGQRRTARKASKSSRKVKTLKPYSPARKNVSIAILGGAAGVAGASFVAGRTMNTPLALIAGGASGVAGARFARRLINGSQ